MFGQGITGSNKNVPQWIRELVSEIERDYDFKLDDIYFKEPTRNKDYYGACYSSRNYIELYFSREKNKLRTFIILHELGHAIQDICYPETVTKRPKGKNRVNHNNVFWDIVGELYLKYDVLEVAITNEYKKGQKYLQKNFHLDMKMEISSK